jgi:hypothetical protein
MTARQRISVIVFWGLSLVMVGVSVRAGIKSEARHSRLVTPARTFASEEIRCPRTVMHRCPRTVL